jgi:hypothetical protein
MLDNHAVPSGIYGVLHAIASLDNTDRRSYPSVGQTIGITGLLEHRLEDLTAATRLGGVGSAVLYGSDYDRTEL